MPKRLKFLLLLLLSFTSVFFAEVIAGSSKYPFYDFWGLLVVVPLYGLHTIVLLFILKKYLGNRKILFASLYFAGVLFGLYEAYLTKVLWVGLSPDAFIFLQISIIDFIVLVFFWHPIFAFIIPCLVFEGFMTKDRYLYEGLPTFLKKMINSPIGRTVIFGLIGLFMTINASGPLALVMSAVFAVVPLILLYYFLRKKDVHKKYSLSDILPNNKEIKICIGILVVMYVVMGLFINGEVLTLYNQLVIWSLYVISGSIFYHKIKKNRLFEEEVYHKDQISIRFMIHNIVVLIITGVLISSLWIFGVRDIFMIVMWIIWIIFGLILLSVNLIKKSTN